MDWGRERNTVNGIVIHLKMLFDECFLQIFSIYLYIIYHFNTLFFFNRLSRCSHSIILLYNTHNRERAHRKRASFTFLLVNSILFPIYYKPRVLFYFFLSNHIHTTTTRTTTTMTMSNMRWFMRMEKQWWGWCERRKR